MKIGVVVHGPHIVDSGYAKRILRLLEDYGEVKARLGGTMGRTAVYDANLEDKIDIRKKLLPSESIDKFADEGYDVIFLLNYGKSNTTGHAFGFKVFGRCKSNPPLIQIERPGEKDGSVIPWTDSVVELAADISRKLGLRIVTADRIIFDKAGKSKRKIAGVSSGENIFVNGIVIGKATCDDVTLVTKNGVITKIIGGKLKKHAIKKLGKIDLKKAIIKTGLLRKSKVSPRVLESKKYNGKFNIAFLDHAAEDIYKLKDADMVVTVGDDTTLVAGDILYRFGVPIIGITDGDIDKVLENGFKTPGSVIIEFEDCMDDIIGKKIFSELFCGKKTIETNDMENFKKEVLKIINKTKAKYKIKTMG